MMIVFTLLFVLVGGAKIDGSNGHTKVYTNMLESLYIKQTYFDMKDIRCSPVNSRAEYVAILASRGITDIPSDSWHMEHIIDQNGTPYAQNKNILGNLIMANATWNRQIGQLTWSAVEREKRAVYGEIFDLALSSVVECGESDDVCVYILYIIITIPIFVILIAIVVVRMMQEYNYDTANLDVEAGPSDS